MTSSIHPISIRSALSLALLATLSMQAQAQDDAVDNIVATGSRTTNLLTEVPFAATVINLEDIEARNKANVIDLLRSVPGLHVIQPSGQGGTARVYIRGADLELTMILLDGVRVNDPNDSRGSAFDFSTINMNDVERIEIVRGPQSAVYGSDALGGVINIISKHPSEEIGGSAFLELGTDEYYRAAVDLSGPVGEQGGFSLRVATKDDGEPVPGSTFKSDTVSARLALADDDRWHANFFGNYTDSEGTAFPEDSGGYDLAVIRETDARSAEYLRFGVDAGFAAGENWRINFLTTWFDQETSYLSPGVANGEERMGVPANGADAALDRLNVALNAVFDIGENLTATIGADHYDEDGSSEGFFDFGFFLAPDSYDFDRSVTGLFGEAHYRSDSGFSLLASVRRDDPDGLSGETTSKLGLKQSFNGGRTSVRANWGQGFKLPGFSALSSPLVGNPDLVPETSESLDIGLTQAVGDGSFTVSLFRNEFTNLIDFDSMTFRLVNRDKFEVDGVEVDVSYPVSEQVSVYAQATWLDMTLVGGNEPIRRRPDWRGSVSVRWAASERLLLDASWLNVGETYDSSIPTGGMMLDSYNRVDATATWMASEDLSLVLSVDNILDEDIYEAIGFPSPGIRGRLGVRWQF